MRSALRCVTLCAILAAAVGFDSAESNESYEEIFVPRFRANTFINNPPRNIYKWGVKPVAEQRSEVCELYVQCRLLARHVGSQAAYQRFFHGQRGPAHRVRY